MPVSLAQAKLNAVDDVDVAVIDEFRKNSWLLDNMMFDDVVNPAGGGATLTYAYTRLITQPTAAFRAYNAEYTPAEVTKQRYSTDLKPLGGSFQIDRVFSRIGPATANEVALQMNQKIKASNTLFSDAFINGDTAVDANSFDGLDKALTGSTTEYGDGVSVDWSGITTQAAAFTAMGLIDTFLALLDGPPSAIYGNARLIAVLKGIARFAGYYSQTENAFGQTIDRYGNTVLIDPGAKAGSNNPIIPIESRDVDGAGAGGSITGLTDMYAFRLGLDGVHGVSLAGAPLIQKFLPDFSTPGAVKTGEVELGPVSMALKATKAAAVFRNIKVQ